MVKCTHHRMTKECPYCKFPLEVKRSRATSRDYRDYPLLEPQDFVRIHERDLEVLLRGKDVATDPDSVVDPNLLPADGSKPRVR